MQKAPMTRRTVPDLEQQLLAELKRLGVTVSAPVPLTNPNTYDPHSDIVTMYRLCDVLPLFHRLGETPPSGIVSKLIRRLFRRTGRWLLEPVLRNLSLWLSASTRVSASHHERITHLEQQCTSEQIEQLTSRLEAEGRRAEMLEKLLRSQMEQVRKLEQKLSELADPHASTKLQLTRDHAEIATASEQDKGALAEIERHLTPKFDWFAFEQEAYGTEEYVKFKVSRYLPYFPEGLPVVDLGCGRGEFLEVLEKAGFSARGVDRDPQNIDLCRTKGLDVQEGDLIDYLEGQQPASLGGIILTQVIEHLPINDALNVLRLASEQLAEGGVLVVETVNPLTFSAMANFLRDLTHVRPLHPETLAHLFTAAGLTVVETVYQTLHPNSIRLQHLPGSDPAAEVANANIDKLNNVLFGYHDYAVIGKKGGRRND